MRPFTRQIDQLQTIPGVGQATAEVIIAETGADMSRFRTAAHLASWAGVCPGHHESAGKRKSGKTRHGNRWLGAALGTAAMAAARTKDTTYLGARYQRLVPRLGKKKAIVATEHSILTALWHMLTPRCGLPRSRRGLLHPARPRPRHETPYPPNQRPGIHRPLRPHPDRLTPPTTPAAAGQLKTPTWPGRYLLPSPPPWSPKIPPGHL
jgi:Transposase IS116/IS110/IS902 family